MAAVGTRSPGGSSSVCHQGARGVSMTDGSTHGTPPSGVVMEAR